MWIFGARLDRKLDIILHHCIECAEGPVPHLILEGSGGSALPFRTQVSSCCISGRRQFAALHGGAVFNVRRRRAIACRNARRVRARHTLGRHLLLGAYGCALGRVAASTSE
jgi:hypothetical protein